MQMRDPHLYQGQEKEQSAGNEYGLYMTAYINVEQ